jgi:hypothetical protein
MKGLPFVRMTGVNYQTFASWVQKRRHARGDYAKMASKRPSTAQPSPPHASLQLVEVALPTASITPHSPVRPGRLIRTAKDQGICAILDNRILTKPYGRAFFASLPECPTEVVG